MQQIELDTYTATAFWINILFNSSQRTKVQHRGNQVQLSRSLTGVYLSRRAPGPCTSWHMAKQELHVEGFLTQLWDWLNITETSVINSIHKPQIPASHAIELENSFENCYSKTLRLAKAIKSIQYYTMLLYFSQTSLFSDFFSKHLLLALLHFHGKTSHK